MSEYNPQETDISVQLLRQVHGHNPRLIESLLRKTEPVLPKTMPNGSEKSLNTLFRNNKRQWEHEKMGNPGVFDAISAPKPGTAKDREIHDDVTAMGWGSIKKDKKGKGKKTVKKVPKGSSAIMSAPLPARNIAPRRVSVRQQLQTLRYNTRSRANASTAKDECGTQKGKAIKNGKVTKNGKVAEEGKVTKKGKEVTETEAISDSKDDSDYEFPPSRSVSGLANTSHPLPPSSPATTQPATAASSTPASRHPPVRRPSVSPLTPASATATSNTRTTPCAINRAAGANDGSATTTQQYVPPPQDSPIHPPLADVQTDMLDRALKRYPCWAVAADARKAADVDYAGIPTLVAGMKAAVARGDAFEGGVRAAAEEAAGVEANERRVEGDVVGAWGQRSGEAAERFFGANPEVGPREERQKRAAKMVETKRRRKEERGRAEELAMAEEQRRERAEARAGGMGATAATSKGKREELSVAAAETISRAARLLSGGTRKTRAQVKDFEEFLAEAGVGGEVLDGGDAEAQQREDETEVRQPAVSSKRRRTTTSGPFPRTPIRTRSQVAAHSSQLTPAMSAVAISVDEPRNKRDVVEHSLQDTESMLEDEDPKTPANHHQRRPSFHCTDSIDGSMERLRVRSTPRGRKGYCSPRFTQGRVNVNTRANSRTSPAPSKRKVSFANISDGERSGVKKTRIPRNLQRLPYPLTPMSESKRRRNSSSSEEATPAPKNRRRLMSMKDLRLQEAAKSGSASGPKAKQPTERPESSYTHGNSDHGPELSSTIIDLAPNDEDESAHRDNRSDPLTKTTPAGRVSKPQPQKRKQAPSPSTNASEAPENHPAHDWSYRMDPALTFSERVQESVARNLGRHPSNYTGDSRAIHNFPSSSSSSITPQHCRSTTDTVHVINHRAVTNVHDTAIADHDDATADAASSTGLASTSPSPGESRGCADEAGSCLDASKAAAAKGSRVAVERADAGSGEHGITIVNEDAGTIEPGNSVIDADAEFRDEGEDGSNLDDANSRPSSDFNGEQNFHADSRTCNADNEDARIDDDDQAPGTSRDAVEAGPAVIKGRTNTQDQQQAKDQPTQETRTKSQHMKWKRPMDKRKKQDTEKDKILILVRMHIKEEPQDEPFVKEERNSTEERTAQEPKVHKGKERQRDDALAVEDEHGNELLLTPDNFANFERERNRLASVHTRDIHNVWMYSEVMGVADLMNQGYMDPQVVMIQYNEIWAGRHIWLTAVDDHEVSITLRRRELPEISAMMEQLKEDRDAEIAAEHGIEFEMD